MNCKNTCRVLFYNNIDDCGNNLKTFIYLFMFAFFG